jgi:hypothetical protein
VGETTIAAIHGNRANRAGSFSNTTCLVRFEDVPAGYEQRIGDTYAKRPINVYKAPKRTRTATEAKGQGRAQEPAKTREACGSQCR